ncbi:hypothetical protein EJB05_31480, partial [Eragrostis curvula]
MAMHAVTLLLLLSFFMSIMSTTAAAPSDDEAALLTFKAAAVRGGYGDTLASWNASADGHCTWEGVRCRGRHQRVVALSLPSTGLAGFLSPAVGNLSSLRFLNLSSNALTGDIPASIGRLHHLHTLDLSNNAFTSELPANLSSCTSLVIIRLTSNQLSGRIPYELGNKLTRLEKLVLWKNNLTGAIPESLGNLTSLRTVSLAYNQLDGTIPPTFGSILRLQVLDLSYNSLSGEAPRSLYNLTSLTILQIQGNMLRGGIAADIGSRFPSMLFLFLDYNQFTGHIPASLSNLTNLQSLSLSGNRLSGYVPHTLGGMQALQGLYLYHNMIKADDSKGWEFITSLSNCSQLQRLIIDGNPGLTGQLPSSIGNLSATLQVITVGDSGISGSIPTAIGNLVGLEALNAANTSISGVIPNSISNLVNLAQLGLYNTDLSGPIPSSIGNLSKLFILDAHNANLEGPIPTSIGNMQSLTALDLSMNHLNGSIPREIFKLPLLSGVNLSYNSLSGLLPSEVGNWRNINELYLSGNQLSGEIPDSIAKCTVLQQLWLDDNSFEGSIPQSLNTIKGLTALSLSKNKLSGAIPDGIGSIHGLQELYLSHNNLSGCIPISLQNLTALSKLDLSFNNLQGEVPKEGLFRNLTYISIAGNSELCGGRSQLHLAPCRMGSMKKDRKRLSKSLIVVLETASALLFLTFAIASIHFIYKKLRQKQGSPFLEPIVQEQYERVSYQALENGTDGFSEANLLGKGSFGAVYKCTFQDDGTIAAIKVFNLEQSGSTRSFVAECEALRRVRHRCLLKIITCCSSIDHQGQDFKALVFEFMPNGSLKGWLHPQSGMPTLSNTLSLAQRLDIAVDTMDALDYLHNHCQPPIIHCDVKPSNILLAEDFSARLGDFGISRILPEKASITLQNSNSTIGIRGSIGYVAPEYGEGSPISILGDIYSLGILLLEMFTGKSPTDDMFIDSLDLHKFSEDALPERIWEIADMTLWLHTDARGSSTRSRIENCLVSVITLGISCSNKQPKERTLIQDAAIEMRAIRDSYLTLHRSLEVGHVE